VDTFLAIASRRDERRYGPEPLPEAVVTRILDAGRLSGSASNRQPWTFVLPESRDRIEALARAVYAPDNVLLAGLVVAVVLGGTGKATFDAGRAAQNMLLAAWNEGISSCPNGIADREAAHAALALSDEETAAIVLTFGVPERPRDVSARSAEEWSSRANRRSLDDVVRRVR
jgi:nitroreductase